MSKLYQAASEMENQARGLGTAGRNLWCVVQFDGNGDRIWKFSSGKGYEGVEVEKGINHDAEERMCLYFPAMIKEHGRVPASIQMITRASPCFDLCTQLLRGLASKYTEIAAITVASWEEYRGQEKTKTVASVKSLNEIIKGYNYDVAVTFEIANQVSFERLAQPEPGIS